MARMRTLKPEAARSESLCSVPRELRWTFAMLWTYLDDDGRGLYNTRLIKADIYPLDDDMTAGQVDVEIRRLAEVGCVCIYEVDGKVYLHAPNFGEHQHPNRPVASKLPPCPIDHTSPPQHVEGTEPAVSPHERHTPVVVEEGRGGAARSERAASPPPEFCSRHPQGTASPCGPCKTARTRRAAWDREHADQLAERRRAAAKARESCRRCGGSGWIEDDDGRPVQKCDHQPALEVL